MPISKNEVYRSKYARQVVAAGRRHVDEIIAGIQAHFGPGVIDPARTRAEILGQCDLLARFADEQQASSRALDQDLAEDILFREARDVAGGHVNDVLVAVRGEVREHFGPDVLRIYRLDERLPTSQEGLAGYAGDVQVLLESNPRVAITVLGKAVTTTEQADVLARTLATYRTALQDVVREARETELARLRRDEAEARFQRVLTSVAGIMVGYLRLAGLDALADRIRPTRARTSGAVDPDLPATEPPDVETPGPELPDLDAPAAPVEN
jgi:hypothetical protein